MKILRFFLLPILSISLTAKAAEVSVQIAPGSFPVTEAAQFSLTITGGSISSRPTPPAPDGITIRPYGQSTNMQVINGRVSRSYSLTYIVTSNREGEFTIPSFTVSVGGESLKTEAVTFSVTSSAPLPSLPQGQNQAVPNSNSSAATSSSGAFGFLRLEIPKRERSHLYVGEMAPARIKAYFPMDANVSLTSAPRPEGQGFTLHHVSEKPEQTVEIVNGKQYRTLTWYAGISTAKAGKYPIKVSLKANVAVRQHSGAKGRARPQSPFGGNSPFNDPFFDRFFNGGGFDNFFAPMVQREVSLTSPGAPVEIRSLPRENQPEDFSGAVGQFSLGSFKLPVDATTGEPQQIRVIVEGKGNFDRVKAPAITPSGNWKTYSPKTKFTPKDVASFSGSKTFDFSAVAQKGGEQTMALSFSYFDPEKEQYESVSSPEIKVSIAGEDVESLTSRAVGQKATASPASVNPAGKEEGQPLDLAPLRLSNSSTASLQALILRPIYWGMLGVAVLVIISGFGFGIWRRRYFAPQRVAERSTEKKAHSAISAADVAAKQGDALGFFTSARLALQTKLASAWNRPAESITLAELRAHFPGDSPILAIFSEADRLSYSPTTEFSKSDLPRWRGILQQALENE